MLDAADRDRALDLALESITAALRTGRLQLPVVAGLSPGLATVRASFVTLRRAGALRGCIGGLVAVEPLGVDVARHAAAAAFDDPRFEPVTAEEVPALNVEVSVLSIPERLSVGSWYELLETIRPGVDGVTVEAGRQRATLLPTVWAGVPDPIEFLAALWQKAGLPGRAWPNGIRVSRYTTEEFAGNARDHLPVAWVSPTGPARTW